MAAFATQPDHEWVWHALRDGHHNLVQRLVPSDFDWHHIHPVYGTPLMAIVHERILLNNGVSEEESLDELVRFCMRKGANPKCSTPTSITGLSVGCWPPDPPCHGWTPYKDGNITWWHYDGPLGQFWCKDDDEKRLQEYDHSYEKTRIIGAVRAQAEPHGGHSAISLVIAIKHKLRTHAFVDLAKRADRLLHILADYQMEYSGPKVQIHPHVVEMWAKVLDDQDSGDVELVPSSSPESRMLAHAHVLCSASSVLKVILQSGFQEGINRKINVQGVSADSLRYFLFSVYTGCSEDAEHTLKTKLEAIDLAHRWQVEHLVSTMEKSLAHYVRTTLRTRSFEHQVEELTALLEMSQLKHLTALHDACQTYYQAAPQQVKAKLRRSLFGPAEDAAQGAKRLKAL